MQSPLLNPWSALKSYWQSEWQKEISRQDRIRMLRLRFRYDIEAFCHFFYPSITAYDFQEFHRNIFTWHIDDARNKRAVFIIPRRHAKTTVMRMLFVHNGCYQREPYNLNFCETQPQTMQMARAVKR